MPPVAKTKARCRPKPTAQKGMFGPSAKSPMKPLLGDASAWDLPDLPEVSSESLAFDRVAEFLAKVNIVPWGVLGSRRLSSLDDSGKQVVQPATPPSCNTAVVDSAGLHHLREESQGQASGSSAYLYRRLGITPNGSKASFPPDVKSGIQEINDAKYHAYGFKKVIHVASPDLKTPKYLNSRHAVIADLAQSYRNCFREFVNSSLPCLRILPLCGGTFSGSFSDDMPDITQEAMVHGFRLLELAQQKHLLSLTTIELCIYEEDEYEAYLVAFDPDDFDDDTTRLSSTHFSSRSSVLS